MGGGGGGVRKSVEAEKGGLWAPGFNSSSAGERPPR